MCTYMVLFTPHINYQKIYGTWNVDERLELHVYSLPVDSTLLTIVCHSTNASFWNTLYSTVMFTKWSLNAQQAPTCIHPSVLMLVACDVSKAKGSESFKLCHETDSFSIGDVLWSSLEEFVACILLYHRPFTLMS